MKGKLALFSAVLFGILCQFISAEEVCIDEDCDEREVTTTFPLLNSFSLAPDSFSSRGNLIVTQSGAQKMKLKFSEKSFEAAVTEDMVESVKSNGIHRVKLEVSQEKHLMAFMNSCDLAAANFHQSFIFHLSAKGELIGFSVEPFVRTSDDGIYASINCEKLAEELQRKMKSGEVVTIRSRAAASLPTEDHRAPLVHISSNAEFVSADPSITGEGESELFQDQKKKDGQAQGEEEQSFMRKYWYVFLPMFLMSIFGGPQAPAQEGAPGAQPAAAAVAQSGKRKGRKK